MKPEEMILETPEQMDANIQVLVQDLEIAKKRLSEYLYMTCPGPHEYIQHRDGRKPWCRNCKRTKYGERVDKPIFSGKSFENPDWDWPEGRP